MTNVIFRIKLIFELSEAGSMITEYADKQRFSIAKQRQSYLRLSL
ncbi:hypothetical protein CANDROIZ_660003 [Candidatus Roizmanbacteria bacterium]|nr:hypothetical protein CANDROIZ_660003 [Candidatus Roizmanbacteria bacterium]